MSPQKKKDSRTMSTNVNRECHVDDDAVSEIINEWLGEHSGKGNEDTFPFVDDYDYDFDVVHPVNNNNNDGDGEDDGDVGAAERMTNRVNTRSHENLNNDDNFIFSFDGGNESHLPQLLKEITPEQEAKQNHDGCDDNDGVRAHDQGQQQQQRRTLRHNKNKKDGNDDPTRDEAQKLLAQEMEQLNVNERELIYEEVHGVDTIIDETTEFLTQKLSEMDDELEKLSKKGVYDNTSPTFTASTEDSKYASNAQQVTPDAYNKALEMNPSYVRGLRLMFLRADLYRPSLAARRMVQFFHSKLTLFGIHALARPLYLSDLDHDDIKCLKAGHIQLLPERDRSGRAIFCCVQNINTKQAFRRVTNAVKAWVYLFLAAAESEETQRRGIVCIVNMMGVLQTATSTESREHFYEYASTLHWLPIRHVGYHFNMFQDHNEALEQLLAIAIFYSPKENRSRIRIHIGSFMECQYKMMTFGVPIRSMPLTTTTTTTGTDIGKNTSKTAVYDGGLKVKLDNHKKWMARRAKKDQFIQRQILQQQQKQQNKLQQQQRLELENIIEIGCTDDDRHTTVFNGIDFYSPEDVLLGRGRPFREHSGNVRMRQIVERYQPVYDSMHVVGQKTELARQIVYLIMGKIDHVDMKTTTTTTTNKKPVKIRNNSKQQQGRFLKLDPDHGWWIEASIDEATQKVTQAFRTARSTSHSQSRSKSKSSSTSSLLSAPTAFLYANQNHDNSGGRNNPPPPLLHTNKRVKVVAI